MATQEEVNILCSLYAKEKLRNHTERAIKKQGVNSLGNRYTIFEDGGFSYTNYGPDGEISSEYSDTGNGECFFKRFGPNACQFYQNQKENIRLYYEEKIGAKNENLETQPL